MTSEASALGTPHFDVVFRGYDRKQVDEYVARLQRVVSRMRADLAMARSHPLLLGSPHGDMPAAGGTRAVAAHQHLPSPQHNGRETRDLVGSFTNRLQSILQAAEKEAAEIRDNALAAARAEEKEVRAQLADLVRQRDALLDELTRTRGQLKGTPAALTGRQPAGPELSQPPASTA